MNGAGLRRPLLGWLVQALRLVGPVVGLVVGLAASARAQSLPSFAAQRAAHQPSDIPLLDRHGTPLHTVRVDAQVRRGPWVALADISPALRQAIVLSEDRRFWEHGGVDWAALAAAAWANAWNTRTRGASTLTMQLAGLLDEDLARPAGGRSVGRKLGQMVRARQLEAQWSKAQILEAYLNRVPLRGELVGVQAASAVLFGKQPSGLDAEEAAIVAVMVRGPNASATVLERRACEVLRQQALGCEALGITVAQALARRPGPLGGEMLAPHLAQRLAREWKAAQQAAGSHAVATQARGGPRTGDARAAATAHITAPPAAAPAAAPSAPPLQAIPTTLDARVQRLAIGALRRQLAELRGRQVEDGAVLVLDNASGEVRAWVGSSGRGSAAAEVDAVLARRQPGSTLKPFVYGLALQQRLLTPATLLDDTPLQIAEGGALYRPQNYDHRYQGAVSVRQALGSSLNIPAVRVAAMLGPDALFAHLNDAGLALQQHAGHHGHALALGSADVTLLALTNAYRMLARGGQFTPVRVQPAAAPPAGGVPASAPVRVLEPAVAWLVADMLADPAARAATFGLDSPLVTRGWAAVKTGTSKDLRDNWCIGFTPSYTVGVWVGNASGAPMHDVSGISGAAPVWRELVMALHADAPAPPPLRPQGLVAQDGGWVLAGTERGLLPAPHATKAGSRHTATAAPGNAATAPAAFGIQSPQHGSVLLLDPDIPPAAQRLLVQGAPGLWQLNGRPLGEGSRLLWTPRPGQHVLERRDAPGATPDRVVFTVRATPPPPARGKAVQRPSPTAAIRAPNG